MSSRALRKLQREQELRKKEALDQNSEVVDETEEVTAGNQPMNAFDILSQDGQDVYDEEKSSDPDAEPLTSGKDDTSMSVTKTKAKRKSKKKKNKNKAKGKDTTNGELSVQPNFTEKDPKLDEIDMALKSLATNTKDEPSTAARVQIDEANMQLYRVLAVESKHLNALNEMKRLFGNVVMENEDEAPAAPRRRGRGPQHTDLGGALAGYVSPASRGKGLAGLALRRNPFILGKEAWPKAPSGGLGMELVEKMEDGTVEYRFIHNSVYQDVQRQFETCVASLDPQRMISLLQYEPYHISTLLQVSEIAKQQSDHSVSGDLLERALFSFGRSVHSSFTSALAEGRARLDFRRPENREFWLAAWRYTLNLGQRGTWRTAYEWARLMLSLDPEGDPYSMVLILDQLALRGGQSEHFLQMSQLPFFSDYLWKDRPNIRISSALAEHKLKHPQASRKSLRQCIDEYPWIFARLFKALNIDHIPKSIWGKSANSDRDEFDCEVYVQNAKDLWNTPEAISLLVEVAESFDHPYGRIASTAEITLDEARHVLLSGVTSLINFIPRQYTTMPTSSSDPLPPPDSLRSYNAAPDSEAQLVYEPAFMGPEDTDTDTQPEIATPNPRSPEGNEQGVSELQELSGIQGFFRRLIPWMGSGQEPAPAAQAADIERRAAEMGIPPEAIAEQSTRLLQLYEGMLRREEQDAATAEAGDTEQVDQRGSSQQPVQNSASNAEANTQVDGVEPHDNEPYDDDRNQRWLAGQGMLRLRDFTAAYGTDEASWPGNCGQEIVTEYAERVLQLRQQRTRNFIVDYTLRQGTSQGVKDLVNRMIESIQHQR